MEYIPIRMTLKDQLTGEIFSRDATYFREFLKDFITRLDRQNQDNIGDRDCYLVYRIDAGEEILYQWDEEWILDAEEYLGNGGIPARISATRIIKKPAGYSYIAQTVMSNYNYQIDKKTAARLKNGKLYADYTGGNFLGYVWWNKQSHCWFCEIWQHQKHVATVCAETLPEMMLDVLEKY